MKMNKIEMIITLEQTKQENENNKVTLTFEKKDIRPLIRCKECRHAQKSVFKEKFKRCDYNGALKSVDDFCSWAERRKEE